MSESKKTHQFAIQYPAEWQLYELLQQLLQAHSKLFPPPSADLLKTDLPIRHSDEILQCHTCLVWLNSTASENKRADAMNSFKLVRDTVLAALQRDEGITVLTRLLPLVIQFFFQPSVAHFQAVLNDKALSDTVRALAHSASSSIRAPLHSHNGRYFFKDLKPVGDTGSTPIIREMPELIIDDVFLMQVPLNESNQDMLRVWRWAVNVEWVFANARAFLGKLEPPLHFFVLMRGHDARGKIHYVRFDKFKSKLHVDMRPHDEKDAEPLYFGNVQRRVFSLQENTTPGPNFVAPPASIICRYVDDDHLDEIRVAAWYKPLPHLTSLRHILGTLLWRQDERMTQFNPVTNVCATFAQQVLDVSCGCSDEHWERVIQCLQDDVLETVKSTVKPATELQIAQLMLAGNLEAFTSSAMIANSGSSSGRRKRSKEPKIEKKKQILDDAEPEKLHPAAYPLAYFLGRATNDQNVPEKNPLEVMQMLPPLIDLVKDTLRKHLGRFLDGMQSLPLEQKMMIANMAMLWVPFLYPDAAEQQQALQLVQQKLR